MPRSALDAPQTDPTPIFEHFRGSFGSELLTAAVAHLNLFEILASGPLAWKDLRARLQLAERAAVVLLTAMRSMGLVTADDDGRLRMTSLAAEHLAPGAPLAVSDYLSLAADSPGVLQMVERLRTNAPAGAGDADQGAAFIYRDGVESAMEHSASARFLTLALAGRAKNVAPLLARCAPVGDARRLLDVGGGTGIYSIALLQQHPQLTATVFDRPEVLKVAAEFAAEYGVADRLELRAGDMFADPFPDADVVLLSNVLHDWDLPECRQLIDKSAAALTPTGAVWIHDVYLNDALDGPLPIALYSAALFSLTEGRAYSAGEYSAWLQAAGLVPQPLLPTLIHCGLLAGCRAGS